MRGHLLVHSIYLLSVLFLQMAAGAPDPLAIASQFTGALAVHFGKSDLASVGALYGADSVVAIDGTPADGPAAIAEFYKMRVREWPTSADDSPGTTFLRSTTTHVGLVLIKHALTPSFLLVQFAGGHVGMKVISTDAQFTPDAATPKLLVLVTGDTGPAGKAPVSTSRRTFIR